jgi:hypothetical protein
VYAAATAQAGYLGDERCRDYFMVFAPLFNLLHSLAEGQRGTVSCPTVIILTYGSKDSPVLVSEVADRACVELHLPRSAAQSTVL